MFVFGGGVTGDLGGFLAASYLRGIEFVQVPSTLLSMVDSSVGERLELTLSVGKNLVGAFHQPSRVIIDLNVLSTLPIVNFLQEWLKLSNMVCSAIYRFIIGY